jgi:hypothetical protein
MKTVMVVMMMGKLSMASGVKVQNSSSESLNKDWSALDL